jgi:hypothetical protein
MEGALLYSAPAKVFLTGGRQQHRIDHYRTADAECRARPA